MLLDKDGNIISTAHYDEMKDELTVNRVQDVEPILEENKALQSLNNGYNQSRSMKRIASIPNVVAEQWMREDGINWMSLPKHEKRRYLQRKLNSNEYRYLRTSEGMF